MGRWLLAPIVALTVLLGVWVTGGRLSDDFETSMALTTVWFAAGAVIVFLLVRRRPALRIPLAGAFLVTVAVVGGALALTTFREQTVNDAVATGSSLAAGVFTSAAHETTGRAVLVRTPSGELRLTLQNLDTDAGPDLRVYLSAERNGEPDPSKSKDLGGLRGNKGTQQYAVPAAVDTSRYRWVVIWCRAFSVAFGQAELS